MYIIFFIRKKENVFIFVKSEVRENLRYFIWVFLKLVIINNYNRVLLFWNFGSLRKLIINKRRK